MSSLPGVAGTLELLDRLRAAVRDFAAREGKLNEDLRTRIARVRQRRDHALGEAERQLAAEVAGAEAEFQSAKAAAEAGYQRRKARVAKAHKASQRKKLEQIENLEGRRKHKLQTETLQLQRNRKADLAAAETACAEFKAQLAAEQEGLALLESSAQDAFKGYATFLRRLSGATEPAATGDEHQTLAELRDILARTSGELERFRRMVLPRFFRHTGLWLLLVLAQIPLVPLLQLFQITSFTYRDAGVSIVECLAVGFVLHYFGRQQAAPLAGAITGALASARRLHDACLQLADARLARENERIEGEFQTRTQSIEQQWTQVLEEAEASRATWPEQIERKAARAVATNERLHQMRTEQVARGHAAGVERLQRESAARISTLNNACTADEAQFTADHQAQWRPLTAEWQSKIPPLYSAITDAQSRAEKLFPAWQPPLWEQWSLPAQFGHAAQFGRLEVDVEKLCEGVPRDAQMALPGPARFPVPLLLAYPQQGSVLIEASGPGRDEAVAALNNIILRLLTTAPPGRLNFTLFDPVGLGQSFSSLVHLADYAEHLINGRIWTQAGQIEQRLAELNEHMEKVIQMYLRNEYATIAEYNEQAGNIAEKYHFLVVADFPAGFSDTAARRLLSIAASGARCGVFTLIHWDRRQPLPPDFVPDELRKSSVCLSHKGNEFTLAGQPAPGTSLRLDAPPPPDFATALIQKVGAGSRDSNRVEVPFAHVAPPASELWTLDTTNELRVPIGRTGATKLQYLAIGKGTRQHALLAGKTGSGKSTLFHVVITNLSLWCRPDQVEFYLIDFKKGVEFKCYATQRLPHARVVAIESDREFGLSVLQRVDDELKRRGDLFRELGVQDIAGYKRAGGKEPVPRSLLIIDEFQEFFVEDDKVAQTASLLLDRIVRQGRAFGVHVLLGSQTLGGAYTVARTTLGQMVIRIALQCNEADAYLIMDDDNPAPRLLSRPGEGIYNDTAGTIEGNSPFQTVWLPDDVRDAQLAAVRRRADESGTTYPGPIVFEGNAPADLRENVALRALLQADAAVSTTAARIWLGAPNSIKGPTEAIFQRQSGSNLLMVGQRDEAVLAILSVALVSLAAQHPIGAARFILCDTSASGTPARDFLERIVGAIPHPVTLAKPGDLAALMADLAADLQRRANDESAATAAPATFLFVHGLQRHNKLRYEEDFGFSGGDAGATLNPAALLNTLLCEGPRLGFHAIVTCDTVNNVNRFLSRKAISEFEMRVLFQMSANDSAALIDSPKAGALGLHRALFYNEQEGHLETFRPYSPPSGEWIGQAARDLARLLK